MLPLSDGLALVVSLTHAHDSSVVEAIENNTKQNSRALGSACAERLAKPSCARFTQ